MALPEGGPAQDELRTLRAGQQGAHGDRKSCRRDAAIKLPGGSLWRPADIWRPSSSHFSTDANLQTGHLCQIWFRLGYSVGHMRIGALESDPGFDFGTVHCGPFPARRDGQGLKSIGTIFQPRATP